MLNVFQTFEILIKTTFTQACMPLCAAEHSIQLIFIFLRAVYFEIWW